MYCNNCIDIYYCKAHKKTHKKECSNKMIPDQNKKALNEGVAIQIDAFTK